MLLIFYISIQAQVVDIITKEDMLSSLKNFPDDGQIVSLIRSDFENISEDRREVIRMFDRLLNGRNLDLDSKNWIRQKAQRIVIDGDDNSVSAYILNNSNLRSEEN